MELVEAIRARIADPNRLNDMAAIQHPSLLPVATPDEVRTAESVIGSSLPRSLSVLLQSVANGGFGPGYGLLGVGSKGHRIEVADISLDLPGFYRLCVDQDSRWDGDQIVILDWGDTIWGTVSLSTGLVSAFRGDADTYEAQHFAPTGVDLEAWLIRWARGESVG